MENLKSTVAILKCDSYNQTEVNSAIRKGLDLLGGAELFALPKEKILFKPNILAGADPEKCVTTHPAVLAAVFESFKDSGAILQYGDSPAFGNTKSSSTNAGLHAIAEKYGVELADFAESVNVEHKNPLNRKSFPLAKGVLDADGLISVSKLKSHGLTRLTGAVKNQYGCIPGMTKAAYHAKIPIIKDFSAFVVDINTYIKPRLYIMDAVMAMEGNGPNAGDPKHLGCILMSTDPVALDSTACRIIDLDPEFVPTNVAGKRAHLGTFLKEQIDLVGDDINQFIDKSFNVVRKPALSLGDNPLLRKIEGHLLDKPIIEASKCVKCGKCVRICPVEPKKALDWKGDPGKDIPVYDYIKCIRCFCCQETCPEKAITIRTPMIAPLLSLFSGTLIFIGGVKAVIRRAIRKIKGKKEES